MYDVIICWLNEISREIGRGDKANFLTELQYGNFIRTPRSGGSINNYQIAIEFPWKYQTLENPFTTHVFPRRFLFKLSSPPTSKIYHKTDASSQTQCLFKVKLS